MVLVVTNFECSKCNGLFETSINALDFNNHVSVKFHLHTDNHQRLESELDEVEYDIEYERTDLGYTGLVNEEEIGESEILELCDRVSEYMISVLLVSIDQNGHANGIGYRYSGTSRTVERQSRGNDPTTWHGIVYDGMRLDGEDLDQD